MPDEIDSDARSFLVALDRLDARPLHEIDAETAREQQRAAVSLGQGPDRDAVLRVEDRDEAGVPVRVYEMTNELPDAIVMFVHGGGWVLGDLGTADWTARSIAVALNCTVVSVDYRLAPEHPYPAALQDCTAVLTALSRRYPTSRIAVVGDSSGGNLALAVGAASVSDPLLRVDAQLLLYPALDPAQRSPSHDTYADGYVLTRESMRWFWQQYLAGSASNYHEPALDGLPPTIVTTAGFDPLQDEGRDLAERLVAANVTTLFLHHGNLTHAWLDSAGTVPAARRARDEVLALFRTLVESVPSTSIEGVADDLGLVLDGLSSHARGRERVE